MTKMKKRLKGHIKTKHFQKRQQEREVSDQQIINAFKEGSIKEVDGQFRINFGHLNIILDLENNALITVHPGDPAKCKPKILTKDEARDIKILIESRIKPLPEIENDSEDEFAKFVRENSVKKI